MKKLRLLLTLAGILILGSCEIGLGSAVDTDAPNLNIETGIADKVVRGDFALRGKYSDDGSISSLSAVLKRTDGEGSALTFTGELIEDEKNRGSGKWKISIPAKSRPITDGAYQADVTIKDGVGRETVQSTIFTIDNTAPVIVLTRPSTAADAENPDTYGQKFSIEGQAADSNNISRIEIRLFEDKECTKAAGEEPIVLKNVPLSIAMDAASYDGKEGIYKYEGETRDFSINVEKDGNGKPFYCKIYAYDGSSRYLEEGEEASAEDEKGNCAEYYYLYKEIYTPVLQYYKITDLYNILNGTYKEEEARTVSAEGVKEALFTGEKYQKKTGSFILNPKNNPTFTVTGKSPLALDGHDFEGSSNANDILNGQSVFIEVSPGLDDIPLEESSLKVYVIECDQDGKIVNGAKKIYPETEREEKGSSYRFTVKIVKSEYGEEGLSIGKTYLFGVDGYDQSDAKNTIEPSGKAFGFRMAANGNAPVLALSVPEDATSYIKKGGKQTFTGTIDVELGAPKLLVYKDNDTEGNLINTIEFSESDGTKTATGYKYSFSFDYADFGNSNSIHKFILKAEQAGLISQPVEKTVVYDVDAPSIAITKPSTAKKFLDGKGTEDTSNQYLNGTVEFTVMLNDKGGSGLDTDVNKPEWKILNAEDGSVLDEGIITETTGQTIIINTTEEKYLNKTIIFRVSAWDAAGNHNTTEEDDARYTFIIDQSTDEPYIGEDTGYKKLDFALTDINTYYNQTGEKKGNVEKGSALKFKLYEDDGAAKLYILNKKLTVTADNGSGTHTVTGWETDISSLSKVFEVTQDTPNKLVSISSYTFPPNDEDCGFYEYAIVAEDTLDASKKTVKGPFLVRITQDKASITVTKDREYANEKVIFTNTITITPSEGPYRLYRQVVKKNAAPQTGWQTYNDDIDASCDEENASDVSHYKKIGTVQDNNLTAEDTLKIESYYTAGAEDNLLVYYKVIDELGNASIQKAVELKLDNTAPVVVIKSPVEGKTGKSALTETTQLSGTATDPDSGISGSGVTWVWYKLSHNDNEELPAGTAGGYTRMEASNGPFTVDKEFISGTEPVNDKLEEGRWYFYVYAEDDAGNASQPEKRVFDIDFSAPEMTAEVAQTKYNKDSLTEDADGKKTGSFNVTGTAQDSYGLDTVTVWVQKSGAVSKDYAIAVTNGKVSEDGNWTKSFIFGPDADSEAENYLEEGNYEIWAIAKDKAGKEKTSQRSSITIDYTDPEIALSTLKLNDIGYDAAKWYESKTLKVDIEVTDAVSGVSGAYCITKDAQDNDRTSPLSKDNGAVYTGTAQLSKDGADLIIRFKAKDTAGNETEEKSKTVKIDTSAPELEGYKYKVGNGSLKNAGGTVYINNNAASGLTVYGNYSDLQSGVQELSFEGTKQNADDTYKQPVVTYSTSPAETAAESSFSAITDANRTTIKSWKAVFANGSTNGIIKTGELKVTGKNNAGTSGLSTEKKLFTINLDEEYPTFKNPKIEPGDDRFKVYQNAAGVYYLNNKEQTFTISGLAEDNTGVDSVSLKIENIDEEGNEVSGNLITESNATGYFSGIEFKQSGENGAVWTGGARVTITVTDIAGNSTEEEISGQPGQTRQTVLNIKFDTEGPKGLHIIDKKKIKNTADDGTVSYTYDDNGKDLYFRIGDMNRDDGVKKDEYGDVIVDANKDAEAETDAPEWDTSKDKDVGGKYSGNTYGNAETVKIRGAFEDKVSDASDAEDGSGIALIYYKLYTIEPDNSSVASSPDTQVFLADYVNQADGYFSALKSPETKRVFYTDNGDGTLDRQLASSSAGAEPGQPVVKPVVKGSIGAGDDKKYYTEIISNYKTTISGLSAGNNYIALVAVDNVGNASLESVTYSGTTYHNYQINVDYEAPTITSSAPATGLFTKSTAPLTLSGTVTDNPSDVKAGVKDVWLRYTDKNNKEQKLKADITGNTWRKEVPASVFTALYDNTAATNSVIFTATATDKSGSGNSASCSVTVTIDDQNPVVEITERPSGAGTNASGITQVNGEIKIKASATDENGLKDTDDEGNPVTPKLSLYYRAKTDSDTATPSSITSLTGWTKFGEVENNGEWTLHTPPVAAGVTQDLGEGTWYFTVSATDKAGNTGYATPFALEVNKDTDRPVIKFNITFGSSITSDKTEIDGVISDDDGYPAANKVWYYVGNNNTAPAENAWKLADSVFTYNADSGAFTLKPGDGSKYIWFKIEDKKGQTFTTSTSTEYSFNTPKVSDRDGATVMGTKPDSGTSTTATTLVITTDTTAPETKDVKFTRTPSNTASWSNAISAEQFGGTKNTFYLQQYAFDANGVKKVYLSLPVDEADGLSSAITAWSYTNESTRVKTTVFTNGNQPTAVSYYYEDYEAMTTANQKAITAVAANFSTITATVSGTSVTFTREAYIFPLEITSTINEVTVGTNTNTYYLWETPYAQNNNKPVNVANLKSGTRTASLISYDGIRSSSNTIVITIDNTPPVINFSGPSNTNALSGSVTVFGSVDSTSTISYAVSTSATVSPASSTTVNKWYDSDDTEHPLQTSLNDNTAGYTEDSEDYKYYQYKQIETANSSLSWFVYFDEDGVQSSEEGEHQQTLNNYLISYGITDEEHLEAQDASQFSSIVKLYVWIKAEDERGNVTEVPRLILLDPQGDRPEVKLSYPAENGKTYGGQIQLSGSANDKLGTSDDKVGVESVWMQIIAKKHYVSTDADGNKTYEDGGSFTVDSNKAIATFPVTKPDLDYLKDKYDIYNMRTYHTETTHTKYSGNLGIYSPSDYAIRIAPEGSSWNQAINEGGEFDFEYVAPEDATEEEIDAAVKTNDVAVRVYAQDKDGKFSVQKDCYMIFDAQNPVVGSPQALYLIQSADAGFGASTTAPDFKATAYKDYTPDMFVRGQWYLIGSVTDNDAIKTIKIHNDTLITYTNKDALTTAEIKNGTNYSTWTSTDKKTVYFKYKLGTADGVGALIFNIYAEDQASPTTGKTTNGMSIKYDNTAPVIATAADSSYKLSPDVVQSNGRYRLESKVWENAVSGKAQSGLDSVAFYFMRRNTADTTEVDTIYNPMLASDNSVTVNASVPQMKSSGDTSTDGVVYDSGLYWKKASVTRSASLSQLGIASTANHMYIRKGGLVKIGGALYKITERTDTTVTLSGNPPQNETTAYFAIALISDHTTPESGSETRNSTTGYPATITGDDGDGMVDYVEQSGTTYTWSAEIVSKNIPDGPIELHYVAFDAAGNYSIGIMGNKREETYRTSTTLTQTPDRTEYKNLYAAGTGRTSNILYVDGASNVYNTDSSAAIANANYKKAAFVANNAPRISSVKIWTDYSGDNDKQPDEIRIKYYAEKQVISGSSILKVAGGVTSTFIVSENGHDYKDAEDPSNTSYIKGTSFMTIRDKTEFTPEIVGGNGTLKYKSRIGKADELDGKTFSSLSNDWITETNVQVEEKDYLDSTLSYVDTSKTRNGIITFGETADEWEDLGSGNSTDDSDPYWFEYQIWDSTDGTTPGTDSLSAVMRIALKVDYFDEVPPEAIIEPFFWKSRTPSDNSLAWDGSKALGHIELEGDLNDTIKDTPIVTGTDSETGADITTTLGDDPKVSGKIVIRGTAYDNIRLKYLYAKFTDHKGLEKYTKIGEYDGGWINGLSGDGWSASVEDSSSDANGHKVKWTLTIDTAQVKDDAAIAALDRAVTVFAVDDRGTATATIDGTAITGNTSFADISDTQTKVVSKLWNHETDTAENYYLDYECTEPVTETTADDTQVYKAEFTPFYQMDVVPYISGVTTSLSKTNSSNPSVYDRTALGHYPVYSTFEGGEDADATAAATVLYETVKIEGFNIAGGTVSFAGAANADTLSSTGTITIPDTAGSGDVSISIYGISSLNNINNDNASGMSGKSYSATSSYEDLNNYFYNRKPNNENNNLLNDDVIFDVWDFNRAAARPKDNSAKDIMMKVNPSSDANGLIDFSFCDGKLYWSMANGTSSSYTYWVTTTDFIQCNGFNVDKNGNTYGLAAGGEGGHDNNGDYADAFCFMTSKWGIANSNTYAKGSYKLRIGSTVVDNYDNLAKDRYKSPSIASDGTYVYVAYYDLLSGEIRFQGGSRPDSTGAAGTLQEMFPNQNSKHGLMKSLNDEHSFLQVVADNSNNSLGYSGEYVSIGIADSHVVMTWYDAKHGNLMYAYSTNTVQNFTASTGVNKNGWSKVEEPLIKGAGKYCQLAVASDNSVHIACYDSQNGDLKYVKLTNYTGADKTVCTVDSYQNVGKELTIDVAEKDGKQIPYIGYWGTSPKKPRYAYLKEPTATDLNGVKDDKYTGVWECTIVPTIKVKNGVADANGNAAVTEDAMRRINVGVWKNADGELIYSTNGGAKPTATNVKFKDSYASTGDGKCYGNGSNNAVLGYGVKYNGTSSDYVETAQKR